MVQESRTKQVPTKTNRKKSCEMLRGFIIICRKTDSQKWLQKDTISIYEGTSSEITRSVPAVGAQFFTGQVDRGNQIVQTLVFEGGQT